MKKWEYDVVTRHAPEVEGALDWLGGEGWELVSVERDKYLDDYVRLYLKREVDDDQ